MKVTIEMPNEEYEQYIIWKNKKPIARHFYYDNIGERMMIEIMDESEVVAELLKRIKELEANQK